MRFGKQPIILAVLLFIGIIRCSDSDDAFPEVTRVMSSYQATFETVIRTLSDDAMQGRWIYGDGIVKSEKFLQREFAGIGLEEHPEFPGYLQPMEVTSMEPLIAHLEFNGKLFDEEEVVILPGTSFPTIHDISTNFYQLRVFNESTAFDQQQFDNLSAMSNLENNFLFLVPSKFKDDFAKFRDFTIGLGVYRPTNLVSGKYFFPIGSGFNIVYLLTDEKSISTFNVEYELKKSIYNNVIGIIPGKSKPDESVIFSAHFDHLGVFPGDEDPIRNGANDNASGVAALITLAKYFKEKNDNERSLYFIGFNLEELGILGSKYFVEHKPAGKINCVINIDMIANESAYGWGQAFLSGHDQSSLIQVLNSNLENTNLVIHPEPKNVDIFKRSDNYSFSQVGIPAHTVSTFAEGDPCYHGPCDEVELINFESSFIVVEAIAQSTASIIAGEDF